MDPDANYDEQRQIYGSSDPANVERRLELVQSMREWIRNGGFRPRGYKGPAWEPCKEDVREATAKTLGFPMSDYTVSLSDGRDVKVRAVSTSDALTTAGEEYGVPPLAAVPSLFQGARPGKFEASGNIGERLHEIVADGDADDEVGDVNGPGDHWYGLLLETGVPGAEYAVVSESNQGFFEFTAFDTPEEARQEFDRIASEVGDEEIESVLEFEAHEPPAEHN